MEEDENETRLVKAAESLGRKLLNTRETNDEVKRLLLQGWRMTADICPITEFPLFLNKKTNELWSVRLQMVVKKEEDLIQIKSDKSVSEALTSPDNLEKEVVSDQPSNSKDELNNVLKRIGEKLLGGWELLEDQIDGCPLMRDTEGRLWFPATGEYISEETRQVKVEEVYQKKSLEMNARAVPSAESASDDLISKRISEKLLLGWEMLNENCPVTHSCPLMKNPINDKKWSPALDDYLEEVKTSIKVTKKEAVAETPSAGLELASEALQKKLAEWSQSLLTERTHSECKALLELIGEAVAVLSSIKALVN